MTPAAPRTPTATYRLQLQPAFGFADAAGAVPYLASLGVSHLYLSPILQAVPGSTHGYDVVDHSTVNVELGGEGGFRALAAEARAHGLGIVVDIVPNHMAVPTPEHLNAPLWEVLRDGRESRYARWFDIDWDAGGGRLLMPVLAGPPAAVADDLEPDPGSGVLRYHEHAFPLRPGTAHLPLPELLAAQPYELADWRDADTRLNYRRFFTVASLIALRQEDEAVFAATHGLVLRLAAEGLVQGLRVDHPDGLADPRGYLRRLRSEASPDTWITVEKILTGDERLPADWDCAGTTGYDALRRVDGVFVDPAGGPPLRALHHELTGAGTAYHDLVLASKDEVLNGGLDAEVERLGRVLDHTCLQAADRGEALRALIAGLPAYRTYVVHGEPAPAASVDLLARALTAVPGRHATTARALADCALRHRGTSDFPARFGQTSSAAAAKGVEDRAFYRWYVLTSLNEVGGEPDEVGCPPARFHEYAAAHEPAGMTTLSTHDTKRSEDVRARLAVLAERHADWAQRVRSWGVLAARHRRAPQIPDAYDSYLLWQTLVGAWPLSADRAVGYLRKAMREAGRSTSWTQPDAAYEEGTDAYVRAVLADPTIAESLHDAVGGLEPYARVASLGMKLTQLTMPGVPDVYQGGETLLRSLVDPDNRAPVDLELRRRALEWLDAPRETRGAPPAGAAAEDLEKLLVVSRALRTRAAHPDWFAGPYTPVGVHGPAADHAVAFRRTGAVTVATRLPVGLEARGGWEGTTLGLPPGTWTDVLTGRRVSAEPGAGGVPLGDLVGLLPPALPVALLVTGDAS